MFKPAKEQMEIALKGVAQVVSEEELLEKFEKSYKTQTPLTIKLGLDPSAPDIHLGHAVVLRKIKQLQDLGHEVTIIIGDFTGKIGDPSGRSKGRVSLGEETVKANAKTYFQQLFKVLDPKKTTVRYNSEWLTKLNFEEVLKLAATTSVARMLERDDFQKRYANQTPIGIHEFFYPLMQAYDSIEIKADIELGGTDQTFNVLMGRTLQKHFGMEKQVALFMPLLEGLDGVEKMSKSLDNYIGLTEPVEVMFKKVMEVPDELILKYYELATDEHPKKITEIKERLEKGANPRDIKMELATIITKLYWGEAKTTRAIDYFKALFQKNEIPENVPEIHLIEKTLEAMVPMLIDEEVIQSKSEFTRLIKQNGVRLNQNKLTLEQLQIVLKSGDILQIGKKRVLRFV